MEYYFKNVDGELTYTIDMLRLKTYITNLELKNLKYYLDINSDLFFSNSGFGKFALNWKFGNLWVGIGSINQKKDGKIIFCIEFNPNKLDNSSWQLLHFLFSYFNFNCVRYDLAIDIPYNINQLYFTDMFKKTYSCFFNSFEDKTFYFGKGNGHTKIYNKTIESNLDYPLTRYEVTLETDFDLMTEYPPFKNINFVTLCRTPYFSYGGDSTIDAILFAVNNGFPFKDLSRRYKEYIKKDLIGINELSDVFAYDTFCQFTKILRSDLRSRHI